MFKFERFTEHSRPPEETVYRAQGKAVTYYIIAADGMYDLSMLAGRPQPDNTMLTVDVTAESVLLPVTRFYNYDAAVGAAETIEVLFNVAMRDVLNRKHGVYRDTDSMRD